MEPIKNRENVFMCRDRNDQWITTDGDTAQSIIGLTPKPTIAVRGCRLFETLKVSIGDADGRVLEIQITRDQALAMHEMCGDMLKWLGGEKDV